MADRSHLTPVRTTDRRGRRTTVYRNLGAEGGPQRGSSLPQPSLSTAVPGSTVDTVQEDYRGVHRAPTDDGYSNPITRLADSFGDDVLVHPEYYGSGKIDDETLAQLKRVAADPDATVRIYRAAPPGVGEINRGDWVTLSEAYARQHAIQDDDEANDWPIIHAEVPATLVFTDGNDLAEYGYDGEHLTGLDVPGTEEDTEPEAAHTSETAAEYAYRTADEYAKGDPHLAAAQRALLDGIARQLLRDEFARSGMSEDDLAAAVGHPRIVARRVIAGQETLTATTVAAYLRAMDASHDRHSA